MAPYKSKEELLMERLHLKKNLELPNTERQTRANLRDRARKHYLMDPHEDLRSQPQLTKDGKNSTTAKTE